MASWRSVSLGAGEVAGGLQKMGITGEVHVALSPDDGTRLEEAFAKQARFTDLSVAGQVPLRTVEISGIRFRWRQP